MWLPIAALIVLTALAIVFKLLAPGSAGAPKLGSMSEEWLTEHRRSL